jgi:lysine biosynthesis protein LysW
MKAQCPECDSWIILPKSLELWDIIVCPQCDTSLQLVSDRPPELDYEDYSYDDDDDYDDDNDDDYDDDF